MNLEWLRFDWTAIIAERRIKEAMDNGEFDNVPGMGEPLNLEENAFLSADQRMVARILKNANALPEWLQLEKDIERERQDMLPRRERALRALRLAKNEASRHRIAEKLRREHRERVDTLNTMILKYNMTTPQAAQRVFPPYVVRREVDELEVAIREAMTASESASS